MDSLRDYIKDFGGLHIFLLALLVVLIICPFVFLYGLVLRPIYKGIRTLWETKEYGLKTSFRKNFYPEKYEKEQRKKELEKEKALAEPLLPDGKQKRFKERKEWSDAYVVDGIAVYGAEGRILIYVDENVEEFDVPEGVENIYHRCFACCDALKRISLPTSLKRIGTRAFYCCVSLQEIVVPESVYILDEEMFMNCTSLKRVSLPSQTTEIPRRMFYNCRSLQNIQLPENIRIIDVEAFCRCDSLEHIEINEKLEKIQEKAFEDCRSLKEFIMPESMRSFQEGIFNGCHALEHIHFSSQIKDFGGSCCRECWNISKISMPPINEDIKAHYRNLWKEYAEKVDITKSENPYPESTFWTMGDTLYFGIPRLTSVCLVFCFSKEAEFTIPSFVTNIKREAFSSCKKLRTLRLSPCIKTSSDPWERDGITYGFIYDYWPQVKNIIFDDNLNNAGYAVGLIA